MVSLRDQFKSIGAADTSIIHYSFADKGEYYYGFL